ncbi:lipopolysaccharide kinase InaA family protein [Spongorhabdus nitratireducens]
MTDRNFLMPEYRPLFEQAGFNDFESLWNCTTEWFEPPNYRRKGWSGVSRLEIEGSTEAPFFIKRQENHNTPTLLHPIKGVPTYRREMESIQRFHQRDIPTLDVVYYNERKVGDKHQAILISRALDGYQSLHDWKQTASEAEIAITLLKLAETVRHMHDQGQCHMCLYSTHVFVRYLSKKDPLVLSGEFKPGPDIRFIDLEKARYQLIPEMRRFKDLECLFRHFFGFSRQQAEEFLDHYLNAGPKFFRHEALRSRLLQVMDYIQTHKPHVFKEDQT